MATIEGNLVAWERVLSRIVPFHNSRVVQEPISHNAVWSQSYLPASVPTAWTFFDVRAYRIAFLPLENSQTSSTDARSSVLRTDARGYFYPGRERPPTGASGGTLVYHGTELQFESRVDGFWFRVETPTGAHQISKRPGWLIMAAKHPLFSVSHPQRIVSGVVSLAPGQACAQILAFLSSTPTSSTNGLAIHPSAGSVLVHLYQTGGNRLAATLVVEVWWYNGDSGAWMHNPADDFDSAGLGDADAGHDAEVYDVPIGASRVALVRVSGATGCEGQISQRWM